jgi:hypothetical protein
VDILKYYFHVLLSSINDVKAFVTAACEQPVDIDILSGRYIIDAKSIMGLFSVELAKPILVEVHGTEEEGLAFRERVRDFVVSDVERG